MKLFIYLVTASTIFSAVLASSSAYACGPSPQKVEREMIIKADVAKVWAVVGDFSAMHYWHPAVLSTQLETQQNVQQMDAESKQVTYRILTLKTGGSIKEKLRETAPQAMKLGVVMLESDLPVSNYSDAITVREGLVAGEVIVSWVARFNNKANAVEAPVGQDNATAIYAIEQFYEAGLTHLKAMFQESNYQALRLQP